MYSAVWKHNGKTITDKNHYVIQGNRLVIMNVSMGSKGKYTCEGITKNGSFFYSDSVLKVMGEFIKY